MQNPDKFTACVECWHDLRDENSTELYDKLFQKLTTLYLCSCKVGLSCAGKMSIFYQRKRDFSAVSVRRTANGSRLRAVATNSSENASRALSVCRRCV